MTTLDKIRAGEFSWAELATSDVAAAKSFYTGLFGWEAQESPLPDGGVYTLFNLGGRPAAAATPQQDAERAQGIPPHWNLYVSVDDVDKTAAKASELGGNVLAPPFDVMELGRMAVLADPTGAVISLWQPGQMQGFAVRDEHGSFSWTELVTSDTDRAGKFYAELFGWTGEVMEAPGGPPYTVFSKDDTQVAGMMAMPDTPPFWLVYFDVSDAEKIAKAASSSGATVEREPTPIPGIGTFAIFSDPQRAGFAILQPENPGT